MRQKPQEIPEQEPSSQKLIISMALAGFISGVIIIAIYLLTFDTIKENRARVLQQAIFKVLPGTTAMQKLYAVDNDSNQKLKVIITDEVDEEMIFAGYDSQGKFTGYAIQGQAPGFQDAVKILFGYKPSTEKVIGMEVLDSRETPGLGDKIFKDMDFVNEFKNLSIGSKVGHKIKAVKKGRKTKENEIDAITGATISSKVVVKIINQSYQKWYLRLPSSGNEPLLQVVEKAKNQPEMENTKEGKL